MTADDYLGVIEKRLSQWAKEEAVSAPTPEAKLLIKRLALLMKSGGKRFRPRLLFMTYQAYGGSKYEQLTELGLALELQHQFLLVHDDLIDNDTVRYDSPNIVGQYLNDKKAIAEAMGLLAGDLLFDSSNLAVLKDKNLSDKQKVSILKLLNETTKGVIYGEQLDVFNVNVSLKEFTEDKLLQIQYLKTALYTTRLPMLCAATLIGLSNIEQKRLDKLAESFGVYFQLLDDYSDYFSNNSLLNNRPKYRDYRQGKITYPIYTALIKAKPGDVIFLRAHLGHKDLDDKQMLKVVSILKDSGAEQASKKHLEEYYRQTSVALRQLKINSKDQNSFISMLDKYRV